MTCRSPPNHVSVQLLEEAEAVLQYTMECSRHEVSRKTPVDVAVSSHGIFFNNRRSLELERSATIHILRTIQSLVGKAGINESRSITASHTNY